MEKKNEKCKMKKWIILIMLLLTVAITSALDNCERVMNPSDIPCRQLSSWTYPNACNTYTVSIYQSNTTLLDTRTMGDYGIGKCNITFNYTSLGSYLLNFSSEDTAIIIIGEDEDMILGIVLGVGIISALLLFFAFKLDDEHIVLKILFMISSITLLILIPVSTFITTTANAGKTFYRTFLYIFVAFWLYVFLYFCYWILKRLGWIVSGEEND